MVRIHLPPAVSHANQRFLGGGANLTRLSQKDRTGWDRINRLPAVSVNIRANSVHPGIMPPMRTSGRAADPAVRAERMRFIPMRRPGEVDEVEYTILFLASDESAYNHRFGTPEPAC
jgi:hypothetical protein